MGPFQGINRVNKDLFTIRSNNFGSQKPGLFKVSQGPGGFWDLREACRIRFRLSWYLSGSAVPSYDQKSRGEFFLPSTVGLYKAM